MNRRGTAGQTVGIRDTVFGGNMLISSLQRFTVISQNSGASDE